MHRAEQILNAIAARIRAQTALQIPPENIFVHRSLSLAEDADEIPAVTVNAGDDEPAEDFQTLDGDGEIASALAIETSVFLSAADETTLRQALFDARVEVHRAINPDETLDLSFVVTVAYGGAAKAEVDTGGELCLGTQEHRWLVTYHMNAPDPS